MQEPPALCLLKSNDQARMMHKQCVCNFSHINYYLQNEVHLRPCIDIENLTTATLLFEVLICKHVIKHVPLCVSGN